MREEVRSSETVMHLVESKGDSRQDLCTGSIIKHPADSRQDAFIFRGNIYEYVLQKSLRSEHKKMDTVN